MSVALSEIVTHLDDFLRVRSIADDALNGLQVEAPGPILRIATAVDSDLRAIRGAADVGANLLLVHHGLFWGRNPKRLVGSEYQRVHTLMTNRIALYAAHLPLDAHPTVGNNVALANAAQLRDVTPWGEYHGKPIGLIGTLATPIAKEALDSWARSTFGEMLSTVRTGPERISRVAICSGAAADLAEQAAADGADLFITGEPRHGAVHRIWETGQNVLFLGHHASERGGPKLLGAYTSERFGLPWSFIDIPTGV